MSGYTAEPPMTPTPPEDAGPGIRPGGFATWACLPLCDGSNADCLGLLNACSGAVLLALGECAALLTGCGACCGACVAGCDCCS